ncbi:uncharacterized protein LOC105803099 isoform X1 [Gossypium raimondii]|uniref:Uncharacterized protein n=1 Tax=Gossypium raimondii TaxID=29730 RepID=A0A0D2QS65_GOSRA|nr:uncharacterized protein LOC105803099 isoform X1 [Gossypium raimondii]KJB42068.1 hypothetical protein B456_007G136200 [Gossypium raimondii]
MQLILMLDLNFLKDLRFLTGASFVTMSKRGWYMSKTTSLRQGNLSCRLSDVLFSLLLKAMASWFNLATHWLLPAPNRVMAAATTGFWDQSPWLHQSRQITLMKGRAEFVSRSPRVDSKQKMWNSPKTAPAWTNSLVKGYYAKLSEGAIDHQDYYSTFHKTNLQKKFTEQ